MQATRLQTKPVVTTMGPELASDWSVHGELIVNNFQLIVAPHVRVFHINAGPIITAPIRRPSSQDFVFKIKATPAEYITEAGRARCSN